MAILFNNVGAAVAGGAAVTLLTVPAGAEAMALELKFTLWAAQPISRSHWSAKRQAFRSTS